MWSDEIMARAVIKGYDILLTIDMQILADNAAKTKYNVLTATQNILNKTSYKEPIILQEYTICFQITEESKTKENKYGDTRQEWIKISRKIDPTTEVSKTRIRKKLSKSDLDDVTRDPEDWITKLELLRGSLKKMVVIVYCVEMMTHIMSNLPEEYKKIVENLEDEVDDNIYPLTIERICDKLLSKYDQKNEQSETKTSREY